MTEPEQTTASPTLRQSLDKVFGIDLRSLALLRVCLAGIVIVDLVSRSFHLKAHYTDWGVLPRSVLLAEYWNPWRFSIHLLGGLAVYQALLFIVAGLVAVALLVGFRTRLATVVSWILLVSLHARNDQLLQAGDVLLRMMLFWGMFMPLGARCSIDAMLRREPGAEPPPRRVLTMATAAALLQVVLMYVMTALMKSDDIWRTGWGVYYALSLSQFTKPLGEVLLGYPGVMMLLSFYTLVLEGVVPFFLLYPKGVTGLRFLIIFLFVTFHLGLGLTMTLGLFPAVCITAWIQFLPSAFWDSRWLQAATTATGNAFSRSVVAPLLDRFAEPPVQRDLSRTGSSWLAQAFVGVCFLYVCAWNLRTLDFETYKKYFPPSVNGFGYALVLDQYWSMFAPYPSRASGWYVIPGQRRDGAVIDLYHDDGRTVTWERPERVEKTFKGQRWRKYMLNLYEIHRTDYRLHYGRYLCRKWNANVERSKQIVSFEICLNLEETMPYHETESVSREVLWRHHCYGPDD